MAIDLLVLGPGLELAPDPEDPLVARREAVTREVLREGIRSLSQLERDALRLTTRDKRTVLGTASELHTDRETIEAALRTGLLALRAALVRQLTERAGD